MMPSIVEIYSKIPTRLILVALVVAFSLIGIIHYVNTNGIDISQREILQYNLAQERKSRDPTKRDPTIPWLDIFKFVPHNVRLCSKLFNGDGTLPVEFKRKLTEYEKVLGKQKVRKIEGYTAQFTTNYKAYITIAEAPFLKTVCETGFNAGHSTFGWLTINPNVHVYSFDIGAHEYSRPMAAHLQKLYPGRLNVTWGDSTVTLPKFMKEHPGVKCDLVIIDGGHTYDVCKADFYNFKEMARVDNILILDDYPTPLYLTSLGAVWEHGKQNGDVSEFFNCNYYEDDQKLVHGFSVGRYLF